MNKDEIPVRLAELDAGREMETIPIIDPSPNESVLFLERNFSGNQTQFGP
jgi:hypothetical protein